MPKDKAYCLAKHRNVPGTFILTTRAFDLHDYSQIKVYYDNPPLQLESEWVLVADEELTQW